MYHTVLFDLDGTLTDPGEGITNAVMYALACFGIEENDRTSLYRFIGPPLLDSFMEYYGFDREKATAAIESYRVYYRRRGVLENVIYQGTVELLEQLTRAGKTLVIASSKPLCFVQQILAHFGIDRYFSHVSAATLDGRIGRKGDVIANALAMAGVTDKEGVVMVGDRKHDVLGAKENGIPVIGVLWGYGDEAEHRAAGADAIAADMEELRELLLG